MRPPIVTRTTQTDTGCMEFNGYRNDSDYGIVRRRGQKFLAHRWSWIEEHGEIPDGMCVCHHCDNPPYINPDHLFLGTPNDNIADRHAKGRSASARGTDNPNARITEDEVAAIRRLHADREANQYQIAAQFGLAQTTVSSIVRNKSWRHVS